ncbi:amino acid ABC transporter permease [Acidisphaera sp. L21]|uniref:amino acid ABC transporter permease n=1 Tax=Acidisphaera sp. L21 TaxID=1641851 RepID=UPI00131BD74B|nr:ABC transporter permease subunit [Acidisphaera sp. L21]
MLRNLPLVVKMFFFYFVLGWPEVSAALTALILHQSAYIADVTAAGLRSIERGQFDAGLALGLRRIAVLRHIVLPQLARVVLSPMTTQYVSVVKNTSVVALIGVADLTFQTQQINVDTFRGFEAATAATLLYMIVAGVVIAGMGWLQRRRIMP